MISVGSVVQVHLGPPGGDRVKGVNYEAEEFQFFDSSIRLFPVIVKKHRVRES